jgi:hypothetical protein
MKVFRTDIRTTLLTKELADIFRQSTGSLLSLSGRFAGRVRGQQAEYFVPREDSPFSVLDDDPPTFAVGVSLPKYFGGGGGLITVHMYVRDRGDHREVALISPYTFGGKTSANDGAMRVVEAFRAADAALEVR